MKILVTLSVPDDTVVDERFKDALNFYINRVGRLGVRVESVFRVTKPVTVFDIQTERSET